MIPRDFRLSVFTDRPSRLVRCTRSNRWWTPLWRRTDIDSMHSCGRRQTEGDGKMTAGKKPTRIVSKEGSRHFHCYHSKCHRRYVAQRKNPHSNWIDPLHGVSENAPDAERVVSRGPRLGKFLWQPGSSVAPLRRDQGQMEITELRIYLLYTLPYSWHCLAICPSRGWRHAFLRDVFTFWRYLSCLLRLFFVHASTCGEASAGSSEGFDGLLQWPLRKVRTCHVSIWSKWPLVYRLHGFRFCCRDPRDLFGSNGCQTTLAT